MNPVVCIDTDIGLGTPGAEIDDGAALIVLLRAAGVQVRALGAVYGNVPLDDVVHNARRLLHHLGRADLPVGRGAALPLLEDPAWFAGWQSGYGPTPPWPGGEDLPPAASLLIDVVRSAPGQVTLLALGPLTNLALAARLAPDIVPQVRQVIAMGGSFRPGDPAPEFNVRCDPEAAAIVFGAGWPLRLLGLEVTRQVHFSRGDFAALPGDDPAAALLRTQAPGWIDRVEAMGWEQGGCSLHDAVAAAALIDPGLFTWVEAAPRVELHERALRGATVLATPAPGQPAVQVATAVDAAACKALIASHLGLPAG